LPLRGSGHIAGVKTPYRLGRTRAVLVVTSGSVIIAVGRNGTRDVGMRQALLAPGPRREKRRRHGRGSPRRPNPALLTFAFESPTSPRHPGAVPSCTSEPSGDHLHRSVMYEPSMQDAAWGMRIARRTLNQRAALFGHSRDDPGHCARPIGATLRVTGLEELSADPRSFCSVGEIHAPYVAPGTEIVRFAGVGTRAQRLDTEALVELVVRGTRSMPLGVHLWPMRDKPWAHHRRKVVLHW
jgi:hypothetical protein